MLRPEWRLWPFTSFLGLLDLKTGVTVALLFALLNKVAGVYGLIATIMGAGGTFPQLSLYVYSVIALVALVWGLRAVKDEDPKHTLYFAHFYFADHIVSTGWTAFFATAWWFYNPHDGQRSANSPAQQAIHDSGAALVHPLTDAERVAAAQAIWNREKGAAATIITLSWFAKIYFALLIYSYASHLRKGSYRALPRPYTSSASASAAAATAAGYEPALGPDDEDDELYRMPLRTHTPGGSISSFADFVGAPAPGARRPRSVHLPPSALAGEVLFDEELGEGSHSKAGTDESVTVAGEEERTKTWV
ncbi:Inositolphosphorylceramide synthase subunit Kei1-domain-containing protein [Infundibulicybe gibba]|nr:Inositolphosphorylceramide synthase subunit Kei1-domain-containing protein [Infundibulicybe gibba]